MTDLGTDWHPDRRQEDELARAVWSDLFETPDIAMELTDPKGRILRTSPAARVILGRTEDEIVELTWRDVTHPEDIDSEVAGIEAIRSGQSSAYQADKRYIRPDGSIRWARLSKIGIHDSERHVVGYLSYLFDVTDVVELQDRLGRFEGLVQTSRDFIAIAGLGGAVEFVNRSGRSMIGMPDGFDVTTTTIADYLTPEGLEQSLEVEQPAVVAEGYWTGISTLKAWTDGSGIPVEIDSFLVRDERTGEPTALATVQRNITDRVAAERRINELAQDRQELLLALLDREVAEQRRLAEALHDDPVQALAATDLRLQAVATLIGDLTSVNGALNQAQADLERARADLHYAVTSLRGLMSDLDPPELSTGDVAAALRRAANRLFEGSETKLTVKGVARPSMERVGAGLFRVGLEALANARKHASPHHVKIMLDEVGSGYEVSVEDDGIGMAWVENPGQGRGLANMRRRVAALQGTLDIVSSPGDGTRVRCWLPG